MSTDRRDASVMSSTSDSIIGAMLDKDKEASDVSMIAITQTMTEHDYASDLTERQIAYLTLLKAVQRKLSFYSSDDSKRAGRFLGIMVNEFIVLRKSKNRKGRKEYIEMFKEIKRDVEGMLQRGRDAVGF